MTAEPASPAARSRYEAIGGGYAAARRPDARIAAAILDAVGAGSRVVNVGAGTGNYEPDRSGVVAVEPSALMIAQRSPDAAPCVRGVAECLPFATSTFDVAMCTLTVHHWHDRARGLAELRRVSRRQVVYYFEPALTDQAWLLSYWPEILELPTEIAAPGEAFFREHLDVREVQVVPVPNDCTDGFGGAFWARPEAYLDAAVRAGMSSFAQLDAGATARGHDRLRADLASGRWDARLGHLRALAAYDVGYRIVVAGS